MGIDMQDSVIYNILQQENYIHECNFNTDYDLKRKNIGNYRLMCIDEEQIDIELLKGYMIKNNLLNTYFKYLNEVKKEFLYNSYIHGINHNSRVLLYAILICDLKKIEDVKILSDAALYHDIGRKNDCLDPTHGALSAKLIDEIINDDNFYKNNDNRNLLKAIIEIHSLNDNEDDKIIDKYNLKDEEKFINLYSILKDADALDRVRLSINADTSCLNLNYLRNEESFSLIKLAHQLNYFYYYIDNVKEKRH